eukprot:CAMPEP_0182549610 /NCGR_PEP_ID=MMETSP1323-20130603/40428_1 /TAXON_ID=236787 /ORGANISM="Florenciella parvula, Strain RCC1693" /LENGTH=58 /DNA_ID=CAMNT_0024761085 /DNA_START=183 /DNA_END=359 /DNA_ORIENTATION=-
MSLVVGVNGLVHRVVGAVAGTRAPDAGPIVCPIHPTTEAAGERAYEVEPLDGDMHEVK